MKPSILLLMLLSMATANANEWQDDFADAEASQAVWVGDWQYFAVNKHGQLQSQSSQAGDHALLRSSTPAINAEWGCWVRISGTCSAYNLIRYYITLTDEDTKSNGYFIQIGGANKNITLYQQHDGYTTKIIENSTRKKILEQDASYLRVKVTRNNNGMFHLYSWVEGKDTTWTEEGQAFAPMVISEYSGIAVKNSKTRGYDFFIDDIYAQGSKQTTSLNETDNTQEATHAQLQVLSDHLSPNGDGWEDEVCVQWQVPNDNYTATMHVFTADGVLIKQICQKEKITSNTGTLCWDGLTAKGNKAEMGVYVIYVELRNNQTYDTLRKRIAVALTL